MTKPKKATPISKNEQTERDVRTHLSNHEEIDTSDVTVDVCDKSVTLKGKIDNNRAKNLAGTIVSEVNQVGDVINELHAERDISEEVKKKP
jgi:osmotically-inducible protein OsmY